MQGSGIANIDNATAIVKLNETGDVSLFISASDNGMGTDTVLMQLAAETLKVNPEEINLIAADTDLTPYDPGSYASSGAYVTGMAVVNACNDLKQRIISAAAKHWKVDPSEIDIDDGVIHYNDSHLDYIDLGRILSVGPAGGTLVGTGSFGHPASPPPYMAGFAEIEYDPETGVVKVVDYVGVVDCGTVINPPLAKVQVESGIVQGIGYALYEDVRYGDTGQLFTNNFMQYKIPTRPDISKVRVAFEESYEPSGPYGAKSIGEVVINTSAPAIQSAIHAATGRYLYRLPMKPEMILFGE
jgi:CO/xanthine dehydrogenase Mo-binding subunit